MKKEGTALVAVHGVGGHTPGTMQATVAAQLQTFYPHRFGAFAGAPLQIAVDAQPLQVAPGSPSPHSRLPDGVDTRARGALRASAGPPDIAFTEMALAGGADHASSYGTSRLRGQPVDGGPLDIYEMFWADLSHGGTKGGLTVLRQMVQLFLHVASFGRTALGTLPAVTADPPVPIASSAYAASAWGYWLLAVPVALGNLMLLCLGLAFLAFLVPDTTAGRIGCAVAAGLSTAGAVGMAMRHSMRRLALPALLQRAALPTVWGALVAVAGLGGLWAGAPGPRAPDVAFWIALPLALLAATALVHAYDKSRPHARRTWQLIVAATALWGGGAAALLHARHLPLDLLNWFVYLIEGTFAWLATAWAALMLANLWLLAATVWSRIAYRHGDMRRALDTALAAASIPAPLLLMVVLTLWTLTWHALLRADYALMYRKVGTLFEVGGATVSARMERLIELAASPAAMPFLVCAAIALAGAVTALVPSVLVEVFPSRGMQRDPARSRGLWRWLDAGFRLMHAPKWIAVGAFFVLLPLGALLQYTEGAHWLGGQVGVAIGGGALAFLSVTRLMGGSPLGRLGRTLARLRVVIDTAIDVDNWLRERPEGATPRLRIMARYVSLLRHIGEQGYGRIVIVAHSQGSVITLDLLRYLAARNPAFLAGLPRIELLTFGSPLRQLYAARFPAIYGWAVDPVPAQAGVASWRNGYGSGDYVGRNLWGPADRPLWQPGCGPSTREFCTGALAHTHYFDEHSPDVAAAIARAL